MSKSRKTKHRQLGGWLRARGSHTQHPVGTWHLVRIHRALDAVSRDVWERLHFVEVGFDTERRRMGICL